MRDYIMTWLSSSGRGVSVGGFRGEHGASQRAHSAEWPQGIVRGWSWPDPGFNNTWRYKLYRISCVAGNPTLVWGGNRGNYHILPHSAGLHGNPWLLSCMYRRKTPRKYRAKLNVTPSQLLIIRTIVGDLYHNRRLTISRGNVYSARIIYTYKVFRFARKIFICRMCMAAQNDVCGQFQPCTSAQTHPTADVT